ncbi:hypothetical protein GYMLUDRAFT_251819 [Collybiopsis luxurians FD-317 M1]|uniref:Unplaced genomic scaffold GYMLUscaffold_108, whole genome shotgun sequence n=1 Tax=Collybiopsis luxurians FD-317 M1 TaxID=944289 RepID=A0A0D0BBL4_9AGAR|nr:hypothetical protein GYMLUDRAFT_251819 [Collybiopsis luxurians FD-317 M1]
MPSHTAASALIKLFFTDTHPSAISGHPWDWPAWQEITGVKHGLFPSDDKLLPKGLTREDASDIYSYFRAYNDLDTEDKKIKFAISSRGTSAIPGRKKWANWVGKNWDSWKIHAKIVECLHTHGIHPVTILIKEGSLDADWPSADMYLPKALETIAFALFGPEAFGDDNDGKEHLLPTIFRRPLTIISQRSWDRIRRHISRDRNRLGDIEKAAIASFDALSDGKPTKSKITAAIRAVAKWKDIAEIYCTESNVSKAASMLDSINEVLNALGAELPKPKPDPRKVKLEPGKGHAKINVAAFKDLATTEDLLELLQTYQQYFRHYEDEQNQPVLSQISPLSFRLQDVDTADLGVEFESKLTPDELAWSLGFARENLPHQFNRFRHKAGMNPWDSPQLFKPSPQQPDSLLPLRLHWHQLAGVHSIIRRAFTEAPSPEHCTGTLECDEVGLGKTTLAITVIAFMNQTVALQAAKASLPPLLQKYKFLRGKESVDPLPHLIIAPGTLRAQWVQELKTAFLPKSVDIFLYDCPKSGNADFWSPAGLFFSSKQDPQNKIVVTSHSSLLNDFARAYQTSVPGGKATREPWALPPSFRPVEGTLFGQEFLTIILDEGHEMRNVGAKYYAALRAFKQGRINLILTATPLLTSPKDLMAMARLLGIPHFLSDASVEEARQDSSDLRKAKKLDDDGLSVQKVQITSVRRIQKQFHGHVVRRTTDSKDWKGERLLNLPPHKDIIGILTLTDRESEILVQRAEDAKANVMSGNDTGKFLTRKFYMEYRLSVAYAKSDSNGPDPVFETMDEWKPIKSTKMDTCAQICAYYLYHDDVPDVEFANGKPVFGRVDRFSADRGHTRKRKILIYSEFPSMTSLLRKVLSLYNVKTLAIDGNVSFERRAQTVAEFHESNDARVFIFSSVGTAGLNLAIADVVIFFDQPWSAQDERQIRGRAHRQPQREVVKAIYLLADNSTDILMNNMARGKKDMYEAFVNKDIGKELSGLLSGEVVDAGGGQEEIEDEVEVKKARKGKKAKLQAQKTGKIGASTFKVSNARPESLDAQSKASEEAAEEKGFGMDLDESSNRYGPSTSLNPGNSEPSESDRLSFATDTDIDGTTAEEGLGDITDDNGRQSDAPMNIGGSASEDEVDFGFQFQSPLKAVKQQQRLANSVPERESPPPERESTRSTGQSSQHKLQVAYPHSGSQLDPQMEIDSEVEYATADQGSELDFNSAFRSPAKSPQARRRSESSDSERQIPSPKRRNTGTGLKSHHVSRHFSESRQQGSGERSLSKSSQASAPKAPKDAAPLADPKAIQPRPSKTNPFTRPTAKKGGEIRKKPDFTEQLKTYPSIEGLGPIASSSSVSQPSSSSYNPFARKPKESSRNADEEQLSPLRHATGPYERTKKVPRP